MDLEGLTGRRPGPGTLNGAIARLEDGGLIARRASKDRRKPYGLTRRGVNRATEELRRLETVAREGRRRLKVAGGNVTRLIRVVPEPQRARFRDEIQDSVQMSERPFRDRVDLIRWGARLRMKKAVRTLVLAGTVLVVVGAVMMTWVAPPVLDVPVP